MNPKFKEVYGSGLLVQASLFPLLIVTCFLFAAGTFYGPGLLAWTLCLGPAAAVDTEESWSDPVLWVSFVGPLLGVAIHTVTFGIGNLIQAAMESAEAKTTLKEIGNEDDSATDAADPAKLFHKHFWHDKEWKRNFLSENAPDGWINPMLTKQDGAFALPPSVASDLMTYLHKGCLIQTNGSLRMRIKSAVGLRALCMKLAARIKELGAHTESDTEMLADLLCETVVMAMAYADTKATAKGFATGDLAEASKVSSATYH